MSHKHHNYVNYSKPQAAPVVEAEVKEEEVIAEPAVTEEVEVVKEIEEVVEEVKSVIGIVECKDKLNVRAAADAEAMIVGVIKNGTPVVIDEAESTDDFYKVCTEAGLEGFCMKKFINI